MQLKSFIILPLLFGAACGTISNLQSATPKQAEYSAPAHESTSASVTLSASPEEIVIKPLASGGENYFEASIDYIGTISYSASAHDDGVYNVTLTENANNLNYSGAPLTWDIGIDPSLPLTLDTHSSSGALTLDLSAFTVTDLHADTSSGAITATLPATDQAYNAAVTSSSGAAMVTVLNNAQVNLTTLKTSSGSITLNAGSASTVSADIETSSGVVTVSPSDGAAVTASVDSSSGAINLNFGANVDSEFTLTNSSGAITIDVPEGAALRLEIAVNSSGAVTVPGWLHQLSGDEKTGVWESDGYNTAEHQIAVTVARTSSGAVTVK